MMTKPKAISPFGGAVLFTWFCLAVVLAGQPAAAQQACSWSTLSNPLRQLVTCGTALVMEREAGSDITIFERAGQAPPRAIELKNGAILIEVAPGSAPTDIRTPHAIAAVRGTTYVVDAGVRQTSVFVVEGEVSVTAPGTANTATLGAGEGVDVGPDIPFEVNSWSATRASALLARFGR